MSPLASRREHRLLYPVLPLQLAATASGVLVGTTKVTNKAVQEMCTRLVNVGYYSRAVI